MLINIEIKSGISLHACRPNCACSGVANSIIGGGGGGHYSHIRIKDYKKIYFKRNYVDHEYMIIASPPPPFIEFATLLKLCVTLYS